MPARYVRTSDGRLVAVPSPAPTPLPEPEEEVEDRFAAPQQEGFVPAPRDEGTRDENKDLFEVTEEDILGSPSDNPKQELDDEDMDDLFGVDEADIMGEPPRPPKPKRRLIRRTNRPYYPPGLSNMR